MKKCFSIIAVILLLSMIIPAFAAEVEGENDGTNTGITETSENGDITDTEEPEIIGDTETEVELEDAFVFSDSVRVGQSFNAAFRITTVRCFAVMGRIYYDSSLLEYKGCVGFYGTWNVSFADNGDSLSFIAFDSLLATPAEGQNVLFELSFNVKPEAEQGSEIVLTVDDLIVSDGTYDIAADGFSSSVMADRALSSSSRLYSLDTGRQLTPAFSEDITEYALTVPADVNELSIGYTADELAKVEVSGNEFVYGDNLVTVTVTSEDRKNTVVYIINVFREYPVLPSSESSISSLTLSAGKLAPAFSPEITEYAIIIDDDTETVDIVPLAADAKASVENNITCGTENGSSFTIRCTAEDGTSTEYRFTVYNTYVPEKQDDDKDNNGNGTSKDPDKNDDPAVTDPDPSNGFYPLLLVFSAVLVLIAFSIGFLIAFFVVGKKQKSMNTKTGTDNRESPDSGVSAPGLTDDNGESKK